MRILVQIFVVNNRGQTPYFRRISPHANPMWARLSMEMTMKTWWNLVKASSFDTSPGIRSHGATEQLGVLPLLQWLNSAIRWNAIMAISPHPSLQNFLATVGDLMPDRPLGQRSPLVRGKLCYPHEASG